MSDVGDTFLDAATCADHDFKPIDMPGATRQEPHNLVQVSTEIDEQQEARTFPYYDILFSLQLLISIN